MRVRGSRRCTECGAEWSYYETGEVTCPDCGSVRSVGMEEERRLHTDAPVELDLSEARSGVEGGALREVAADAAEAARSYVLSRGFVSGGDLRPLDDAFLAAAELRHAADRVRRSMDLADDEERYFLALLSGAEDGDRPGEVPEGMWAARGLAAVEAVEAYRTDVSAWLDERDRGGEVRDTLDRLRDHEKRIGALDGEVPPAEADRLVAAARDIGESLRDDDETALARAEDRLSRLG